MRTVLLAAMAAALLLFANGAGRAQAGSPGGARIYLANGASGTLAEYDLQSHALVESSTPISPFGATGNVVVGSGDAAWFEPGCCLFYKLHAGQGEHTFKSGFRTYHPTVGPIVAGRNFGLYAIDTRLQEVAEYSESKVYFPKQREADHYSGGGIGPHAGMPTHIAVDTSNDVWVTANNASVTLFSSRGVQAWSYPAGTLFTDATTQQTDAYVLYESPAPAYFANASSCTPAPSGPVTRYAIATQYVNGAPAATLYSPADTNPPVAHIAVDSNERVYVSTDRLILDFDPGTQCPDDALQIDLHEKGVMAPLATYSGDLNLYVADPVANTIEAYAGGSTTRLWQIGQPSGQSGPVSIVVQ